MNTVLILVLIAAAVANIGLLVALLSRSASNQTFAKDVREDLRVGREELRSSNKEANESVAGGIRSFTEIGRTVDSRIKDLQEGAEAKLEATRGVLDRIRETVDGKLDTVRGDLAAGLKTHSESLVTSLDRTGATQVERLDVMTKQVKDVADGSRVALDQIRETVDGKLDTVQKELASGLKAHSESLVTSLDRTGTTQLERLDAMTKQVRIGNSNHPSGPSLPTTDARNRPYVEPKLRGCMVCLGYSDRQ